MLTRTCYHGTSHTCWEEYNLVKPTLQKTSWCSSQMWRYIRSYPTASHQLSSVAQSCLTLCNRMDWSTPGFPAHHQFPEFTQTHVYQVSDAIQPSHPLSSPSPPAFPISRSFQMSQFFTSASQNIGVSASESVLPMNIQDWLPLGWIGCISLQSKGDLTLTSF